MASQTTEPTTAGPERIAFEVERLEQADGGRVEVEGRWFGVRGRRFVRPTLTLLVDGAEQRYLADLEQKPWAAEDGEHEETMPFRGVRRPGWQAQHSRAVFVGTLQLYRPRCAM